MTTQQSPFLRLQREFPTDSIQALGIELDKSYIDTAQRVNDRIIGLYPVNFLAVTGESWYFVGQARRQQSLRQVYTFTAAGSIAHGINWNSVSSISPKCCGTYTDGTNWYGVMYSSSVAIAGQISFYITPTNIVILAGAGAPAVTSGYVVLEYVSVL